MATTELEMAAVARWVDDGGRVMTLDVGAAQPIETGATGGERRERPDAPAVDATATGPTRSTRALRPS